MLTRSTRRWLAGLGVAGAFVAASAAPAAAADSQIKLSWYFDDTTIGAGSDGKVEYGIISASAPAVLHDLTVRYDFSDLAGKADVTTSDECTKPSDHELLCVSRYEVSVDEWGLAGIFPLQFTPTAGAKEGDSGKLKTTVSADGFDALSHEASVRIGEGVDLAAGPAVKKSVAPGKSFTAPLTVTNAGGTTVKGTTVVFHNDYGLNAGKHFSNCTYVGDRLLTCQFKNEIPAGASFSTTLPYVLGADTYAPGSKYGELQWMTPAEFEDYQAYLDHRGVTIGEPGTDGELSLRDSGTKGVQADTKLDNNWTSLDVEVTGKNGADLEALGASVKGKAGDKVKATVGVRNNGPATLDRSRGDSPVTLLGLDVPKGTTAVGVPDTCVPANGDDWGEPGTPGRPHYICWFDTFLKAADKATLDFTLRIDKVIPNSTGLMKINVPCACDAGFLNDLKPANDTAKIVVNATGDGGQGGGDGGTLPITGSATGLIAGLGALLLAAGFGGYVVARRRKTRFVA
ncbi:MULTISPECIES: LPXTG cell wall anchor domain-containing protein [Micromonospora]|uniref:LPXTG cell wall anchor domain-containing protein n=1 Tax=Micromonospora solifontis TaxID=2487138 RepID=A0ABX9WGJ3_9ACTN|nr:MULTISPECIES: LPXTG cell wall anchor domain-containing protein [Micromonospora]NES14458.1 LPXTG cell wall anchor domain-containing protein [Micromonospora sp. PPF5-17B]NES36753.1 LPXTG cell wall anchor domain-containing protein [Micromonospora solifontis]NES56389.1 LPXTG cell wall anchor domain-containing protein [Micromonospora sp. PPF5-6]RNL99086.1 LPXTG cell wall anchor domain-containing protein [Micromonospora solifontis]